MTRSRHTSSRRAFLQRAATAGACVGAADLGFLSALAPVDAAEARLVPGKVRLDAGIEPLVRLLEDTPRERLLEEVALRLRRGLSYRELLAALLLAGVRNIQPRPVGFKFHAVLVVNSAHLASLSSPDADRWLPIFWALDYFKDAQAQDAAAEDWTMGPPQESLLPPSHRARRALIEAMDNWDVSAADAAVASLARHAPPQELFELFCRYGARDYRDIGHKAIYVANSWRTLECIGWQHAEPVLRSLAYALLAHEGDNPARRDASADHPWRNNLTLAPDIRAGWLDGRSGGGANLELFEVLRHADAGDASRQVVTLLNGGVGPEPLWDACFAAAIELLMRRPNILSLHAVTTTNALHYAFRHAATDETRRLLLLQNAAFLPLFRGDLSNTTGPRLDDLTKGDDSVADRVSLDRVFAEMGRDRMGAARMAYAYLRNDGPPGDFIDAARRLVFLKGTNSHDYKFSSAVLEDYYAMAPAWRDRYLAASVFNLRGSGEPDQRLVQRIRAALAS